MAFTKEEALKYHREMWGKIREEYGNNATNSQRFKVKTEYVRSKDHVCVNDCYLCDYSYEKALEKQAVGFCAWDLMCTLCPIDWSALADEDDPEYGNCIALYKNGYDSIYKCAPIDEILALPEREVKE